MSGRLKGLKVPERYDQKMLADLVARLSALEDVVHTREGDVEISMLPRATNSGGRKPRLILVSPNGNRYSVIVDDGGSLGTVAV